MIAASIFFNNLSGGYTFSTSITGLEGTHEKRVDNKTINKNIFDTLLKFLTIHLVVFFPLIHY